MRERTPHPFRRTSELIANHVYRDLPYRATNASNAEFHRLARLVKNGARLETLPIADQHIVGTARRQYHEDLAAYRRWLDGRDDA